MLVKTDLSSLGPSDLERICFGVLEVEFRSPEGIGVAARTFFSTGNKALGSYLDGCISVVVLLGRLHNVEDRFMQSV